MQEFPSSRIGELYKNPEHNIAYLGHLGIEFGGGLVISKFMPLDKGEKPPIYHNNEIIGKVKYTNCLMRNNHMYAYTSAFNFNENDELAPIFLIKKIECITCGKVMNGTSTPCNCVFATPILILHDYKLVGCELKGELNYTNMSSNRENILVDFFKNEYSFLEIHGDYSIIDGDKWSQRISLDIDI
jgi:hypothetical protein